MIERGIRKILTFAIRSVELHIKFSGKQYRSPCNFEKTQVLLERPNRYKFYSAAYIAFLPYFEKSFEEFGSWKTYRVRVGRINILPNAVLYFKASYDSMFVIILF